MIHGWASHKEMGRARRPGTRWRWFPEPAPQKRIPEWRDRSFAVGRGGLMPFQVLGKKRHFSLAKGEETKKKRTKTTGQVLNGDSLRAYCKRSKADRRPPPADGAV